MLTSPGGVREGLTERIQREITNHKQGKPARIALKLNSLVDERIIDQLYLASQAGVPVDVLVRGMCSLKPGVKGLSETIRVRSILGRYLEHSRIFYFENNGAPDVFIGSADMMHRNLDRRVETLIKIVQQDQIEELRNILNLGMSNEIASWHLGADGIWIRKSLGPNGGKLADLQDQMMFHALSKKSR
jgi:polyphosphate kinase